MIKSVLYLQSRVRGCAAFTREAATLRSMARWLRKARISSSPIPMALSKPPMTNVVPDTKDEQYALLGVTFVVKENETANPIDVSLFGANAVAFHAQVPADAIEEFGRRSTG